MSRIIFFNIFNDFKLYINYIYLIQFSDKDTKTQTAKSQSKCSKTSETTKIKKEIPPKVSVKKDLASKLVNQSKATHDKTPEKVELSVITDDTQMKNKNGGNEPLQFKVSLKKTNNKFKADLTSPTGRSHVFTGMSPVKPKLRSSMNELIKKSVDINCKKLPRVEYTTEHLVKLPWPNDSNEDAAWVSGHHICLINELGSSFFPSLCFLCGSAGQEKVN